MAKFCINCGSSLDEGAGFCPACGAAIEGAQPAQAQQPPQSAPAQPEYVQPAPAPPAPAQPAYVQPQQPTPTQPEYAQPASAPQPAAQPAYQQPAPAQPAAQPAYQQPAPAPAPAYAYAAPAPEKKKKKFPKLLRVLILLVAAVVIFSIVLNVINGNTAKKDFFTIGNDQVPSVKLVLGEERKIGGTSSAPGDDVVTVIIYEVTENQNSEMLEYALALINDYGFINITNYNFTGPTGSGFQFAKESVDEGLIVVVQIDYNTEGYVLTLAVVEGTLTAKDGGGGNPAGEENGGANPPPDNPVGGLPGVDDLLGGNPLGGNPFGGDGPAGGGSPGGGTTGGGSSGHSLSATSYLNVPSGQCSINEMIDKYGQPDSVDGYYMRDSGIVVVFVEYSNATITFSPIDANRFSFYNDLLKEGHYELSEKDKDLSTDIIGARCTDPALELPNGNVIGTSTKQQIIESYDERPIESDAGEYNFLYYNCSTSDRFGYITYFLDNNDLLESINVLWITTG